MRNDNRFIANEAAGVRNFVLAVLSFSPGFSQVFRSEGDKETVLNGFCA